MAIIKYPTRNKVSAKLQTRLLTTKVLIYFRYIKHYNLIATESGYYHSDVLAINKNNYVTEVEVKITYNDFLHEFQKTYFKYRKASKKHEVYANLNSKWIPNYFYFAVPEDLYAKVSKYIEKNYPKYGIIVVDNGAIISGFDITQCRIAKIASRLHNNYCSDIMRSSVINRMSSELVLRRTDLCNILYKKELNLEGKNV